MQQGDFSMAFRVCRILCQHFPRLPRKVLADGWPTRLPLATGDPIVRSPIATSVIAVSISPTRRSTIAVPVAMVSAANARITREPFQNVAGVQRRRFECVAIATDL
jgi:hypothetical protein